MLNAATELAERLRTAIEAHPFNFKADAPPGHITTSIGIASCATHSSDPRTLVAAADAAMYLAKEAGRNRVVGYAPALAERTAGR